LIVGDQTRCYYDGELKITATHENLSWRRKSRALDESGFSDLLRRLRDFRSLTRGLYRHQAMLGTSRVTKTRLVRREISSAPNGVSPEQEENQ